MNNIKVWEDAIKKLPVSVEGEPANSKVTKKRDEFTKEIESATAKIAETNALHDKVTNNKTTADRRIIGHFCTRRRSRSMPRPTTIRRTGP